MKNSRRDFLIKSSIIGSMTISDPYHLLKDSRSLAPGELMSDVISIELPNNKKFFEPLERVDVIINNVDKGLIKVYDARGTLYHLEDLGGRTNFKTGGCLGHHIIQVFDSKEKLLDQLFFPVFGFTYIEDKGKEFNKILEMLRYSLFPDEKRISDIVRFNHKYFQTFSGSLDHDVQAIEGGLKYFDPNIINCIDAYLEAQGPDGMIYDQSLYPASQHPVPFDDIFREENLVSRSEDQLSSVQFYKHPFRNNGQYKIADGIYSGWKASGDDTWMTGSLEKAANSIQYLLSSSLSWSKTHQLLKMPYQEVGFSLDKMKNLNQVEARDIYNIQKTVYNIHFGDNLSLAVSCLKLSEMFSHIGEEDKATKYSKLALQIKERIDNLAWNGSYYNDYVPESAGQANALASDSAKHIDMWNALALKMGLDHQKCISIIKSYQNIRKQMPDNAEAEWFSVFPPFENNSNVAPSYIGFNGGLSTLAAGHLAKGAFDNGFESYGVDILKRIDKLSQQSRGRLLSFYPGMISDDPPRNFTNVNLAKFVNANKIGSEQASAKGWIGSESDDFRNLPSGEVIQQGIPFRLIDPSANGNKACLILTGDKEYINRAIIPINAKAASIYILHTCTPSQIVGQVKVEYTDNTYHLHHITTFQQVGRSRDIAHWKYPDIGSSNNENPNSVIWWRGAAKEISDVGLVCWGLNNPFPDKVVKQVVLTNEDTMVKWAIFGLTTSDYQVYYKPVFEEANQASWAVAPVISGLIEGLVGVKDRGRSFDISYISPKWEAADINESQVMVKYAASDGYVSYRYRYSEAENKLIIDFTGNAKKTFLRILVPKSKQVAGVFIDREMSKYTRAELGDSDYADIEINGVGVHIAEIRFS